MTILDPPPLPVVDRATLAALVAHPHRPAPFAIDADNRHAGQLPGIAEAVATDAAYALTVAPDVLAIDADDPASLAALDRFAEELATERWPVLRTESGRAGHRHLWAVVTDPAALDRLNARAVWLGLPAPRPTMRPPGTPHRAGLPVHLVDDLDTFVATVAQLRALDTDRPERYDWRHLLTTGSWPRGWTGEGSPSSMVWHVCIGAARSGLGLENVRRLLADPANGGGHAYRARLDRPGKSHADHWLDRYVWPSASERAGRTPDTPADATEARERLDALAAAMHAAHWSGVAGATDRAVLAALVDRGYARGSITPTMSHRELAEAVPCSRRTVLASTRRIAAAGWLQTAEVGRGRTVTVDGQRQERADATRWRLRIPDHLPARTFPTGGTPPASTSLSGATSRGQTRARLDACRWRGLGLNAPRVLDTLDAGQLTAAELADRLTLNRGNLRYRVLPRLEALGLLTRTGDQWAVVDDLDTALEAAAEALELTGKADTVALEHAAERAAYLDHRERTRPRRDLARRRTVAASTADRRAARTTPPDRLPFAPDRPAQAPETASTPSTFTVDPSPPPDPVQAAPAVLTGAGGGNAS